MVYVLLTWWDGLAPSCFDRYWFHLWLNLRLPPDAGGIFLNAAGIFPGYFRLVSSVRCLFLSACRSSFHPGFSRAASVAFGVAVSSRSKNLTLVAVLRHRCPRSWSSPDPRPAVTSKPHPSGEHRPMDPPLYQQRSPSDLPAAHGECRASHETQGDRTHPPFLPVRQRATGV
jgi:hypothetical protein